MALAENQFFEGTEKLLEVWFSSTREGVGDNKADLTKISR